MFNNVEKVLFTVLIVAVLLTVLFSALPSCAFTNTLFLIGLVISLLDVMTLCMISTDEALEMYSEEQLKDWFKDSWD